MPFLVNKDHLTGLEKGVDFWNHWRQENPLIKPDLSSAYLREANLSRANLSRANLIGANLSKARLIEADLSSADLSSAYLREANLSEANLSEANLIGANLIGANLSKARLIEANLSEANLSEANLSRANLIEANLIETDLRETNLREADLRKANLSRANLSEANLIETDLRKANLIEANLSRTRIINVELNGATLTDCRVFGISAWGLIGLEQAAQSNLVITPYGKSIITVDDLEVAQFIYILLHSKRIRNVIDTLTSKVVLILGRFTPERKSVLDAIRSELRKRNYLPVLFDFPEPASQELTETVSTLANMARFVIADITNARSMPQELQAIVPDLPSVPVQPILLASADEYDMFEQFKRYPWVLKIHRYNDIDDLLKSLEQKIIGPAENKAKELQKR